MESIKKSEVAKALKIRKTRGKGNAGGNQSIRGNAYIRRNNRKNT